LPAARLVIVGNGMVGHRLCERLVEQAGRHRHHVTVIGEEPTPAYDRVHLADMLRGRPKAELLFRHAGWYEAKGIALRLGDPVECIDRQAREVVTASGARVPYDRLVLATGSRPVIPSFAGDGLDGVMAYRTLEDAERILREIEESRRGGLPLVVIGGGLLGLEAARTFQELSARVTVIESASQVLPRQLDPEAAWTLQQVLSAGGLDVRLRARVERIDRAARGFRVGLAGEGSLCAGAVVVAIGVRPRDELALAAGLRPGPRGGVEVDAELASSDPAIFAIGECASHKSVPHGLVAPGYAMADLLAENLLGRRRRLGAQQAVTRLKLDLSEVTVLGSPAESPRDRELVFRGSGVYRRLLVQSDRVVAATCVGAWDELPELQRAVSERSRYRARDLERFASDGTLGCRRKTLRVLSLPDAAVVCQCASVTKGALLAAIASGTTTPEALGRSTSAGTLCGSCRPLLVELTGGATSSLHAARTGASTLTFAAAAGFALALATLALPRISLPERLSDFTMHVAWTDPAWKQASGFIVVFAIVLGLSLSLRKRIRRLAVGAYSTWRSAHAVLGVLALVALFVHTGFRLGNNLNRVLVVTLLVSTITGALVGVMTAAGQSLRLAPAVSGGVRRVHDISF
jgi:nitrite reductase (NADH) large subunit